MSHVTDVKLRVHDLDALAEACEKLGLELRRGQKTYAWWGTFVGDSRDYGDLDPKTFGKGEHAIGVKGQKAHMGASGPWEIGVVHAPDGDGYKLVYDKFGSAGGALTEKVERNANALRREYAAAVATKRAKALLARQGFRVERVDAGRGIRLKLRKR